MMEDVKQIQDDSPQRRKYRSKRRSVYTCLYCRYESNRTFNMERHEERIHWRKKLHRCCGRTFFTKGNYYIHCAKHHPTRRIKAIMTQTKYKITSDSLPTMRSVYDREFENVWSRDESNSCEWQFKRRYSQRISEKMKKSVLSHMSLTYELTYCDMENIPLIRFLKDRRLRPYMERLSALSPINKTDEKPDEDANQSVNNVDISSNQDVEKTGLGNTAQETPNRCRLPAKKLLLHRFRKNVSCKFEMPFREQNNNRPGQVNFAETTTRESVSVIQNWSANCKRGKENLSTLAFSFEQQLHVNLDRGIAGPMVTELHRDFLAAIDFDKYKIF